MIERILGFLGLGKSRKRLNFVLFRDGLGNFELLRPEGWAYDSDIAVIDGRYTLDFKSPDGRQRFVVSVDASIPSGFRFAEYAHKELESPSSGVVAGISRARFRGMPAFRREFQLECSGERYYCSDLMFNAGAIVFVVSFMAPERIRDESAGTFRKMLDSFRFRKDARQIGRRKMPGGKAA